MTPRVQTPPLVKGPPGPCGCGCALTPETSFGFAVVEFAEVLGRPLDPWQRHVVIHAGEVLPSGLRRFRIVLVIVARQNGKTELCVILSLFWLFVQCVELVLGTSTKLDYAKESWLKAIKRAKASDEPELREAATKKRIRKTNGEQVWTTFGEGDDDPDARRYKIAASNAEGGRSLTIDRLILDELRQHHSYEAWDASVPATDAVPDAQVWAITNQGSDKSIVLNDLHASALSFIETGEGVDDLFLAEYSAPPGSIPTDIRALAMANPNLGHRISAKALMSSAIAAMERGGEKLAGFLTETMCIRVRSLEPEPIPIESWLDPDLVDEFVGLPKRLAFSLFVGPDRDSFAIGVGGWLPDGRAFLDVAARGSGSSHAVSELARLVGEYECLTTTVTEGKKWKPSVVGDAWSLKALLPDLQDLGIDPFVWSWTDVAAACAGLQDGVRGKALMHRGRAEVTAGLTDAKPRGLTNGWVWDLKNSTGDIVPLMALTLVHRALLLSDPVVDDWSQTFG